MLPSPNRLKGKKNFDKVKKEGRVFQSANFGVAVLKRGDKNPSRFGFIISTKISKAAVHRNRVLRALREAIRQNLKFFPLGYDLVFLTKKSILTNTTDEIMKQVESFVRNVKISE